MGSPWETLSEGLEETLDYVESGQGTVDESIFMMHPPDFDDFVESPEYLGQPPLTPKQKLAFEESVGLDPLNVLDDTREITTLVLEWGKGSGKDMVSAHFVSWVAFILLCLRDIGYTMQMPPGEHIDIVNVAPSGKQSREIFFAKLKTRLERPCFQEFGPNLTTTSCTFLDGSPNEIRIHSEHSESETYEGYNVFAWVMDEASAFRSATKARNADKVYNTLRTSASTRFKTRWVGVMISFPRIAGDFIQKMIKLAETQRSLYGMGPMATWEMLPWLTREDFDEDYSIDPEDAAAKLECKPPSQYGKFFRDLVAIDASRLRRTSDFLTIEPYLTEHELGDGTLKEYAALDVNLVDEIVPGQFWIHGDPGATRDLFAVAIGTTIIRDQQEIPAEVALIEWLPHEGRQIDFLNVAETIVYLCSNLDVVHVTFDQWNSVMLIQEMVAHGINATDVSFSNKMQFEIFKNFRALIDIGRCEITDEEILYSELKELERRNNRIDHPEGGSKDAADAVGTVLWFASGKADLVFGAGGETIISDASVFQGHQPEAIPAVADMVSQDHGRSNLGTMAPFMGRSGRGR